MPASESMSNTYFHRERNVPFLDLATLIPKEYLRGPRYFVWNCFWLINSQSKITHNHYVIHINNQQNPLLLMVSKEYRMILLGTKESKLLHNNGKSLKPCFRILFQPIKWFSRPTNIRGLPFSNKTQWLLYVDLFLKYTMKESILYVKLM